MCVTNARCWIIELDGRVCVTYRVCQERETIGRICGLNKVTAPAILSLGTRWRSQQKDSVILPGERTLILTE